MKSDWLLVRPKSAAGLAQEATKVLIFHLSSFFFSIGSIAEYPSEHLQVTKLLFFAN